MGRTVVFCLVLGRMLVWQSTNSSSYSFFQICFGELVYQRQPREMIVLEWIYLVVVHSRYKVANDLEQDSFKAMVGSVGWLHGEDWEGHSGSGVHLAANTKMFKRTLIYYDTDTQYAHFGGNPLHHATNRHLNNS